MSGARRPEDRNSTEMFDDFPGGATLTELNSFIVELRGRGAPGDAHPRVKLNEDGEVIGMVCTVQRHPEINEIIARNSR